MRGDILSFLYKFYLFPKIRASRIPIKNTGNPMRFYDTITRTRSRFNTWVKGSASPFRLLAMRTVAK